MIFRKEREEKLTGLTTVHSVLISIAQPVTSALAVTTGIGTGQKVNKKFTLVLL
jgi:hypothetical protein